MEERLFGARAYLDTARGEIYSDFEVEVEPSERIVEREDNEDGVSIRIESVIIVKINGGGPVVRMNSLNGDINIRKD